jgi:hypothetical protein
MWKQHGTDIITRLIADKPEVIVNAISKVIPREFTAEVTHIVHANQLTDDDLADIAAGSSKRTTKPKDSEAKLH